MNLARAFRPKNGISFEDTVGLDYTANDPRTGGGNEAPVGSILIYVNSGVAKLFRKNNTGDLDWVEISSALITTTSDPTSTTDASSGYARFDQIINTSTDTLFICVDATTGSAIWQEVGAGGGSGLPNGGSAGQALIKQSATDGDASWNDINEVPDGGTSNQVLTKDSNVDGEYSWQNANGGGGNDKTSTTKEYYNYYGSDTDLSNWQNTASRMNDRHGDPSWYNSGYQVSRSNYEGALIIPHEVNKISVGFLLGLLKNKTGNILPVGTACNMRFHIVIMGQNNITSSHTITVNATLSQAINGNQTSQRNSPLYASGSLELTTPIPQGSMVGISATFVDSGTFQARDDFMVTVNYEE